MKHPHIDFSRCADSEEEVFAFHPGPPANAPLPVNVREEDADRLRRLEDEMLALSLERHIHAGDRLGELAVAITALRA